jgi:hypothetical protein
MYDYWSDIENIEQYTFLPNYSFGTQLTLTDDNYYINGRHQGLQVCTYSTSINRTQISGTMECPIASRSGKIQLIGSYSMATWHPIGKFNFVKQQYP